MFGALGPSELVFIVIIAIIFIIPGWRICQKAGYPGILSIGFFVPLVNLALVLFLAFAEWPVERQLREIQAAGRPYDVRPL